MRGTFHLSLTVLVHYRSSRVFSLRRWSAQVPTQFHVLGGTQELFRRLVTFRLRGSHPLWPAVPDRSPKPMFGNSVLRLPRRRRSYNPAYATPAGLHVGRFRLFPVRSPLLREYFLFLGVREMFQFPRCPPYRYGLAYEYWVMKPSGLPHSEIPGYGCTHLTEAYRSVATSFIGPRRPGIHPAPLVDCVAQPWASARGPALRACNEVRGDGQG